MLVGENSLGTTTDDVNIPSMYALYPPGKPDTERKLVETTPALMDEVFKLETVITPGHPKLPDGLLPAKFPFTFTVERKTVEGNRSPKLGGGYTCPLMVDTTIDEMEPPFEVIEEVLIVDVLTVTKFAVANALLVFISPCRLMLLALKVLSDVRRPDAWTTAPATVPVADTLAAVMFPVAVIVEARKIGGVGAGKRLPLIDETVSWGVDIQLEPVMKVPLTWLEPVTVLKLPDEPKT